MLDDTPEIVIEYSTAIRALQRDRGDLLITFISWRRYRAKGAGSELEHILRASSAGVYFNRSIRNRYTIVEET